MSGQAKENYRSRKDRMEIDSLIVTYKWGPKKIIGQVIKKDWDLNGLSLDFTRNRTL